MRHLIPIAFALAFPLAACSNSGAATVATGGDPHRGAKIIRNVGCGSCHSIPGIADAVGKVGPPLDDIGERTIIAGMLPNTSENMIAWVENPQSIVPGNAMPNTGLTEAQARDVAAYLYTLR